MRPGGTRTPYPRHTPQRLDGGMRFGRRPPPLRALTTMPPDAALPATPGRPMALPPLAIVAAATLLIVVTAVFLHYEASALLSRFLAVTRMPSRPRMLVLIFGLLAAHVAEIGLFGVGAWLLLGVPGTGTLTGEGAHGSLLDVVYLSAATYSTLGYGDVAPAGDVRFLFSTEGLTGLVMITWSASLTFIEMQRHWKDRDGEA